MSIWRTAAKLHDMPQNLWIPKAFLHGSVFVTEEASENHSEDSLVSSEA